ncbi:putative ribonuclease H-like domain-containing protein [Tanacetum coccineum]
MSEFYEEKGIKKEFSAARTPQQNDVAERRNMTLIEAAKTMLVDSKLPTTFWAEAVNTACYVQNRFDGKSDEGFFIGYSLNSKDFRVYNIRTRKVEESLTIRFLEDKPIIAGDEPKWLFDIDILTKSMNYVPVVAGTNSSTEESIGAGHLSKETQSSQDYILMPLWKDGSLFDSSSNNVSNDEPQPSGDARKKDDEGVNKESGNDDQERPENSTQDVHTAGPSINTASTNVNTGSLYINNVSPTVTTAPLEATHANFFGDEIEIDMSNITATYLVLSTLNTRIYTRHSQLIIDWLLMIADCVQTRSERDLKGKSKILKDPSWIEAMQEELLQFKLQQVWTLVDLPYGKRAISTKWVYRNKKDKRVVRIEAIRLFLAYASFKDFLVYQMDAKSAFLYGKIEEKVYVYQPPGFEDPEFPDRVYKVEKALYGLHQAPRAQSDSVRKRIKRYSENKKDKELVRIKNDDRKCFLGNKNRVNTGDTKDNAVSQNLPLLQLKPEESDGFEGIIDFLNASSIRYVLTMNPTIYTSCIKQFWAITKAKTINGEVQIQALVDGKKVIVIETSVRRAL